MSKRSFVDTRDMQVMVDSYFEQCDDDKPLTVVGLAVHLGISRETLNVYATGEFDHQKREFDTGDNEGDGYSDILKRAKDMIEQDKLEKALIGKYNTAVSIFDLKNNHGYTDKIENSHKGTLGVADMTESEIDRRIAEALSKAEA